MKCILPAPRTTLIALGTTISLILISAFTHQVIFPIIGWFIPSLVADFFDLAVYGTYPVTEHVSFDLEGPSPSVVAWDSRCLGGYILVAPFGDSVPDAGPMILDSQSNLVWMASEYGTVMNFNTQMYRGEPHLTFWTGHKVGGIGQGHYVILNSSYHAIRTIEASIPPAHPDDLRFGDLHEFVITNDDTALITVYNTTSRDLSAMGRPVDGWIVDSLFQEIDIETGSLLFEWRASDHFDPATTSQYINPFGGYKESSPYDFFHINSIQKDRYGNYLISSRHLHNIIYISGQTGNTLWMLGGEFNTFTDLTGTQATSFKWQHHAQWVDEAAGILSLFDNESAGPIMTDASESQGLLIQLDTDRMTAKLLQSYSAKNGIRSASQGSVQVFDAPSHSSSSSDTSSPEKHVLVGWGSSAAFSEYLIDGTLLCETHLAASITYWFERVKSYRAFKTFDWIGRPTTPPRAVLANDRVYVSWNGATEVGAWQLEGNPSITSSEPQPDTAWELVDIKEKDVFETSFELPSRKHAAYRVAALDAHAAVIEYSAPIDYVKPRTSRVLWYIFGIFAVVGGSCGVWMFMRRKAARGAYMPLSVVSGSSGSGSGSSSNGAAPSRGGSASATVPASVQAWKARLGRWRLWSIADQRHRYRKVPGIEMN